MQTTSVLTSYLPPMHFIYIYDQYNLDMLSYSGTYKGVEQHEYFRNLSPLDHRYHASDPELWR